MTISASARVALWMVVWLAVIDVGVNLAFKPKGNAAQASGLQRYFEYGRSVEGKLARAVAADPAEAPILSAGWIDPNALKTLAASAPADSDLSVTVYGQSFTFNATKEASQIDGHIALRGVGGPNAPPNHSYAAYKADGSPAAKSDVAVLGILSSSVPQMGSMSGLIWMFESPAPFTFPRYRLEGDQLTEEWPVIRSEAQFRSAFSQRAPQWQQFKAQLRQSDRGYDRFTFDESIADASSVVRLIRRGWVAHSHAYEEGVYTPEGSFNPEAEEVRVLKAMLLDVARRVHERKQRLVVLLLHARGHGDQLNAALAGTLRRAGIDYISTHEVFSANDPSNFLPDGHYTEAANRLLAKRLLSTLRPSKN